MQNHDLRTLPAGKHLRSLGLAVFGALCAFQVSAANLAQLKNFGVTSSGNSAKVGTVNKNSNWDSVLPISPESGGWAYAGNYGIPQAAKGPTMSMSGDGKVFFADGVGSYGGVNYPFKATHTVPGSTLVDVIGAIASGPIGIGLFALPFVLEWLTDSGGRIDPSNPSALQRQAPLPPGACTVSPCYNYRVHSSYPWQATKLLACQYGLSNLPSKTGVSVSPDGSQCWYTPYGSDSLYQTPAAPSVVSWLPSSMDDIAPYMKQTPFDPRVVPEILDKGGDIPFPAPTVTGPSEILGTKTETLNPDGTKTISQPKSFFTPSGDTIINIKNETSVTVLNIDNSVSSVTTTTKTPVPSEGVEPLKTEDPCLKNPDRNGCRTDEFDVPDGEIPKETRTITFAAENLGFAGGTCPANRMLTMHQSGQTITAGDWATTCEMTVTYAKPMILIMATFAALMIIFGFGSGRSES
jgi:hypothetical protein